AKRWLNSLRDAHTSVLDYRSIDGKRKGVYLGTQGSRKLERPTTSLWRKPIRSGSSTAAEEEPAMVEAETRSTARGVRELSQEALETRIARRFEYHQIEGVPRISWDGQHRTRYIQIITPVSIVERQRLLVHEQIHVPRLGEDGESDLPL